MRFLLWLAVGALVIFALRSKLKSFLSSAVPPVPDPAGEAMLCCAHCGVYIPASEAIRDGEAAFCSDQHRQQYLPGGPPTGAASSPSSPPSVGI
jgi:uncharacterized protein